MVDPLLRKELVKSFFKSLLCLLLIPALAWAFTHYVENQRDEEFMQRVTTRLAAPDNAGLAPADAARALRFYREHPPSQLCTADDPELVEAREQMCPSLSPAWQFHWVRVVSFWSMVAGVALLAAILALAALAFVNRQLQYASFMAGSRLLAGSSAAAVLVQGVLGVWLSFWVTAYFFHKYWLQLILIVALAVGGAALVVIRKIFQKLPQDNELEGELIATADAPRLWQRVKELASRLKTEPPRNIVAGIDNNFFVTEAPMRVGDKELTGRTLFVSIPLLRVLNTEQADAVLAHELAHLRGGDTLSSAMLGPQLRRYDHYLAAMGGGGFTMVVYPMMQLYRLVFQLALARDSREREFKADRIAAALVSQAAIAHSLIKVSAYSRYRADVEQQLYGRNEKLDGQLGIAASVASGLHAFASSDNFLEAMKTADMPHPFDSHPPMPQRLANVLYKIKETDYRAVVMAPPESTWADDILTAADIEQRLWAGYEERFAGNHEQSLAYRYEPATEAERELVLKYFPPAVFELAKGQVVTIDLEGLHSKNDGSLVTWDSIKAMQMQDQAFRGQYLQVTLNEKGMVLSKTAKIKLPGLKKRKGEFQAAVGYFWQRHQIMRAHQKQAAEA